MSDMSFWIVTIVLIALGVLLTEKPQWLIYKQAYLKRIIWNAFGRCHKCGHPLSYTPKGRGICTNGECR